MMHDYSCPDVRDRLEAFHDGELTVHERVALQNHLGECSVCRARVRRDLTVPTATPRE